ncbi:MAG: excinuclease ABC subunit UvrC [Chloroflexi bacterium]|nr:excinuclease ABC subunit UvrC [Chloroflexota bacterium]
MEHLEKQLKVLPVKPGIYMFKNAIGNVLYVGKAINLKSRVSSYFNSSSELTPKHRKMLGLITDIDFIITDSELEAIILECNLIKKFSPFYNVRLKDDKTYPYLKIEVKDEWPRVYITRRVERDGSYYFGPYANSASIRITMDLVKKIFPYRSCKKNITGAETRPCLNYHIRRCSAPCISAVSKEEYRAIINEVVFFLESKQGRVIKEIKKKMEDAAGKLEFERAATLRDQLVSIENVTERQKVFYHTLIDEDVIAYATDNDTACVQIFFIREGKLIGKEHFLMEGALYYHCQFFQAVL